jgi:hypothetical protein
VSLPLLDGKLSNKSSVVAVRTKNEKGEQLCSGSVLLPNIVLTARHCLSTERSALESGDCKSSTIPTVEEDTSVTVVSGEDVDLAPTSAAHNVSEIWYADDAGKLCGQDIVLLLLETPVEGKTLPVSLEIPKASDSFTAFGYGMFEGDYGKQRSANATLTCVGTACKDERISANEALARSGACEGDSGGPAVDEAGNVFALVSRSSADCETTAYLTFLSYAPWLLVATRNAAEIGKYDVPKWVKTVSDGLSPHPQDDGSTEGTADESPERNAVGGMACSFAFASHPSRWSSLLIFGSVLTLLRKRRRLE